MFIRRPAPSTFLSRMYPGTFVKRDEPIVNPEQTTLCLLILWDYQNCSVATNSARHRKLVSVQVAFDMFCPRRLPSVQHPYVLRNRGYLVREVSPVLLDGRFHTSADSYQTGPDRPRIRRLTKSSRETDSAQQHEEHRHQVSRQTRLHAVLTIQLDPEHLPL